MSILKTIQEEIEEIYNISSEAPVERFVIGQEIASSLIPQERLPEETVLLSEDHEGVQIGLYIAGDILQKLDQNPPFSRLTERNLDPFCTAIEGVSHFLFLVSCLSEMRGVSKLELELQAEIDKYLVCSLVLERQRAVGIRCRLPDLLYNSYQLLPFLKPEEEERYQLANHLALQYSKRLKRLVHPIERPRWVGEARRFRRKRLQDKIRWLTNRSP